MIKLPVTEILHIVHTTFIIIHWMRKKFLIFSRHLTLEHATIFHWCLNCPHWYYSEMGVLAIVMNYQNGHGQASWSPWAKQSQCVFKDITDFQEWMSPEASPILFPEQPNLSVSNSLPSVTDSFLTAFIHLKLP